MASLTVSGHSSQLYKRKQSPYQRLKQLLFVGCIGLLQLYLPCVVTVMVIAGLGCDKNNSRGGRIDDYITKNNGGLLNDGSYTYLHPATGTFTAIAISPCSPNIVWRLISRMNLIHMVVIIFLLLNIIGFLFLIHYPVGILVGLTECNLINYVNKNGYRCNKGHKVNFGEIQN